MDGHHARVSLSSDLDLNYECNPVDTDALALSCLVCSKLPSVLLHVFVLLVQCNLFQKPLLEKAALSDAGSSQPTVLQRARHIMANQV